MKIIDAHLHFHGGLGNVLEAEKYIEEWHEKKEVLGLEKVIAIIADDGLLSQTYSWVSKFRDFYIPALYYRRPKLCKEAKNFDIIKFGDSWLPELEYSFERAYSSGFRKFQFHTDKEKITDILRLISKRSEGAYHLAHGVLSLYSLPKAIKIVKELKESGIKITLGTTSSGKSYSPSELGDALKAVLEYGLEDNIAFETDISASEFALKNAERWFNCLKRDVIGSLPENVLEKVFYKNIKNCMLWEAKKL